MEGYKGLSFITDFTSVIFDNAETDTIEMVNDNFLVITKNTLKVFNSFKYEPIASVKIDDDFWASQTAQPRLHFVDSILSENTGGGCMVDVLMLPDGRYIGITDEAVVLYPPAPCEDEFLNEDYLHGISLT